MLLGIRIPGFIKIHFRYARRSFVTWCVLFVAPFVFSVMALRMICKAVLEVQPNDTQLFFVSLFIVALLFFSAEKNRKFRKIYIIMIPAMVLTYGVAGLVLEPGRMPGNLIKFGILSGLPAWWLWRHASDKGYKALSDGGDKDYRPGRDLYMDGNYEAAFVHLEPSAKRGHMKSLYLIGHAHETGQGREKDCVLAARFYDKASRKGYGKAGEALERVTKAFSKKEKERFELELGAFGLNELF